MTNRSSASADQGNVPPLYPAPGAYPQYQQQHIHPQQHLQQQQQFQQFQLQNSYPPGPSSQPPAPPSSSNPAQPDLNMVASSSNPISSNPPAASSSSSKKQKTKYPKVFQCQGYGDCKMAFSRSEHLARHILPAPPPSGSSSTAPLPPVPPSVPPGTQQALQSAPTAYPNYAYDTNAQYYQQIPFHQNQPPLPPLPNDTQQQNQPSVIYTNHPNNTSQGIIIEHNPTNPDGSSQQQLPPPSPATHNFQPNSFKPKNRPHPIALNLDRPNATSSPQVSPMNAMMTASNGALSTAIAQQQAIQPIPQVAFSPNYGASDHMVDGPTPSLGSFNDTNAPNLNYANSSNNSSIPNTPSTFNRSSYPPLNSTTSSNSTVFGGGGAGGAGSINTTPLPYSTNSSNRNTPSIGPFDSLPGSRSSYPQSQAYPPLPPLPTTPTGFPPNHSQQHSVPLTPNSQHHLFSSPSLDMGSSSNGQRSFSTSSSQHQSSNVTTPLTGSSSTRSSWLSSVLCDVPPTGSEERPRTWGPSNSTSLSSNNMARTRLSSSDELRGGSCDRSSMPLVRISEDVHMAGDGDGDTPMSGSDFNGFYTGGGNKGLFGNAGGSSAGTRLPSFSSLLNSQEHTLPPLPSKVSQQRFDSYNLPMADTRPPAVPPAGGSTTSLSSSATATTSGKPKSGRKMLSKPLPPLPFEKNNTSSSSLGTIMDGGITGGSHNHHHHNGNTASFHEAQTMGAAGSMQPGPSFPTAFKSLKMENALPPLPPQSENQNGGEGSDEQQQQRSKTGIDVLLQAAGV